MFFLELGLYAGGAIETKDDWWYINNPDNVISADKDAYLLAMLQFTLGWEK